MAENLQVSTQNRDSLPITKNIYQRIIIRHVVQIPLTNSDKVAYVDLLIWQEVYEAGPWYLHHGYARSTRNIFNGMQVHMHRYVMYLYNMLDENLVVDHKDGDKLNNEIINLRMCTNQENSNWSRYRPHSSKYRGVNWNKQRGKWYAQIRIGGRKSI